MPLTIRRLSPLFAAEVLGADVRTEAGCPRDAIEAAMAEYAVVVIRDQRITDAEQLDFARRFGPLELPPRIGAGPTKRHRIAPELFDVSNVDEHGELLPPDDLKHVSNRANEQFHSDSSFNGLPTKWSLLSARVIPPEGGDTHFIDTRAALEALPAPMRERVHEAVAEHSFWKTRSAYVISDEARRSMPPVQHPIVRRAANPNREALYIGSHATHVVGWPREQGEAFLAQLLEFSSDPRYRYVHQWQPFDLLIWDNRCTMHRATPFDAFRYKRDLRRATINESGPEISWTDFIKRSSTEPDGGVPA